MNHTLSLKDQVNAVIYFISILDTEMIELILDDGPTYQNMKKSEFIQKLGNALQEFQKSGDTKLLITTGRCSGCNPADCGISFIGNRSNNYLDLIFHTNKGRITDMFECAVFQCDTVSSKRKRIFIDPPEQSTGNFE